MLSTNLLRTQIRTSNLSLKNAIPLRNTRSLKSPLFAQKCQVQRMASSDHSASTHEKALAALARLTKRDPPRHPSKRTPCTDYRLNLADLIEKALKEAGLRTWGFPIYRCTYGNDSDWADFLTRYRWHISDMLKHYDGLDMLDSFQTTVFEDRAFVGASTATIRAHFQSWATSAIRQESESGEGSIDMIRYCNVRATWYRFCLLLMRSLCEVFWGHGLMTALIKMHL